MSSDASTRARCAAVLEQFERGGEPPWWLTSQLIELAAEDTDFIDLLPADLRDELRAWSRDPAPHPEDVFMITGGSWQDVAAHDAHDTAQRELAFRAGLNLHRLFHPDVPVPAPHAKVRCGVVAEVLMVDGLVAILDEGLETWRIRHHPLELVRPDGTVRTAEVVRMECLDPGVYRRFGIFLDVPSVADVPVGTEVWVIRPI